MTVAAVAALRTAYPVQLPDDAAASAWVRARRNALAARLDGDGDGALAVSSGCAAGGAARHRAVLADQAGTALRRLDDGSLVDCADCCARLPFDRLDAAPAVTSCAGCRRAAAGPADTRWCR